MSEREPTGPGRRGFIGGALAGVAGLWAALRGRRGERTGPPAPEVAERRPVDPWVPTRELVITPDELEPSGDDLAG